ncbi:ribonuclease H2 subunit C isoform X1 [Onthophagus taurus]|uniref:ribonuclease H2 subunit C isoform X1 n=1 Tax=Onthophagus taurus TaxID=166361 RepID=UPI0039BEC0BB
MVIHINAKVGLVTDVINSQVQSVPFKIHADHDAKITKYFNNYVKTKESNGLTCSFRGHPLDGIKVNIPQEYVGVVLHESIRPDTDKEDRKFYATNKFSNVIYWNWNKTPTKNDSFIQAIEWIEIAEVLHSPIVEE